MARTSQTFELTIPDGVESGQEFEASLDGLLVTLTAPGGPGSRFRVTVPNSTSPARHGNFPEARSWVERSPHLREDIQAFYLGVFKAHVRFFQSGSTLVTRQEHFDEFVASWDCALELYAQAARLLPPLSPTWADFVTMLLQPSSLDHTGAVYATWVEGSVELTRRFFAANRHEVCFTWNLILTYGKGDRRFFDPRFAGPVFAAHALMCAAGNTYLDSKDLWVPRLRAALAAAHIPDSFYDDHSHALDEILYDGFNNCEAQDAPMLERQVLPIACAWIRVRTAVLVIQRSWYAARYNPSFVLCRRCLCLECEYLDVVSEPPKVSI
jgi:hypothetical protein